ncbi:MAG: hypothetical protein ACE5I0_10725 [Candidatus Binatia bacterium]
MKRFGSLALALAIFAGPIVAQAAVDSPDVSEIFNKYEETIVLDEGE